MKLETNTFFYLATPYSKYPGGLHRASVDACRAAAMLMKQGIPVFLPIAHSHPIAAHGGLDPLDHSLWLPLDEPMMRAASALIIVKMNGWHESFGIGEEQRAFHQAGKPIYFMDWPDGAVRRAL